MIGFRTTLFLWGELVNLALSRDDGLGTQGLRVLIDPENRSAQEAATTASRPPPAERERRCGCMTDGMIQKSWALFQIPAVIFENAGIRQIWVGVNQLTPRGPREWYY